MNRGYAVVGAAGAALLGILASAPLGPDGRGVAAACALVLSWFAARCDARARIVLAALFAIGAVDGWTQRTADVPLHEGRTARYACTVAGDMQSNAGTTSFACRFDGGMTLAVQARGEAPSPGARVLLRGRIEPFDDARNPGEPSEREIERERGVAGRLASAQVLATLPARNDLAALLARAHGWALEQVRARIPEPQASLIAGELWGERAALPPDVRDEFQETGTVHVLVTAGLHLGVVAMLATWLLQTLRVPRIAACAGAAGCAWAYALFAGGHVPSMRAATMLTFALAARACGRKALSWNALAGAALLIALLQPLDVTSTSFALSFSCVGAILAWATPLDEALSARVALPERVREALAVATATQIGTWPLTAATFLQFAPYAIAANVLVVPVVGCTMLLAGASLVLWWLPPFAQAAANLATWGATWMLAAVHAIASLPNAKIPMTPAPAWCIALYDAAALVAPWLWRRDADIHADRGSHSTGTHAVRWRRAAAVALLAIATAAVLWPPRPHDARLRITVLDVGQADAILVQTPAGHAFLVDAGGRLERGPKMPDGSTAERVGERIVVPFLLRNGIHALDAIVLTHPHGDHAGGVAPVLRALRVGELADGGQRYGGHAYHDALDTARAEHVPILYPRAGNVWRTDDGVTLRFIGPSLPFLANTGNDINDNSIAFVLQYRSFRMLFTGDAGTAAEQRFLTENIDLHADVLKVGHHGSAYGTTPAFLDAVRPRYAIISVGRHNLFGHPAPSTIERLQRFGVCIYRTDENGAVTVTTDGEHVSVTPFLSFTNGNARDF